MSHPELVEPVAERLEPLGSGEVLDTVQGWAAQDERVAWRIGMAMLYAELGESDLARETIAPVVESDFDCVPRDDLYFLSLGVSARTAVLLDDRGSEELLYDLLSPHASRVVVAAEGAVCWGSVHRFLDPLRVVVGNPERAAMHFEAAMAIHERLGALPFLARDRLAYARLLSAGRGDPVQAEDLLRTGSALARR